MHRNLDMMKVLMDAGADVHRKLGNGYSVLHLAARSGFDEGVRVLMGAGADTSGADTRGRTAAHVATTGGFHQLAAILAPGAEGKDAVEEDETRKPTLIITHKKCLDHHTCPRITRQSRASVIPPENVRRLETLTDDHLGTLRVGEFAASRGVEWHEEPARANLTDVLRVHEWSYVSKIFDSCEDIDQPEAVEGLEEPAIVINHLDGDTAVSKESSDAALRAAGAVCEAVDKVMAGECRNVFCAIRPPGHHAGPHGVVTCENDPVCCRVWRMVDDGWWVAGLVSGAGDGGGAGRRSERGGACVMCVI